LTRFVFTTFRSAAFAMALPVEMVVALVVAVCAVSPLSPAMSGVVLAVVVAVLPEEVAVEEAPIRLDAFKDGVVEGELVDDPPEEGEIVSSGVVLAVVVAASLEIA
jgi:hypothetical protein